MAVDLRSDTVTLPSPEMRAAMHHAELGDDVMGEDPTINRLEVKAAERLGKEAAVFIPSGTMGNLLGILVMAARGQEVIVEGLAHVFLYEAAGASVVGGVQLSPVTTAEGVISPALMQAAIRPADDEHQPTTAGVCIEDTHNRHGGRVWRREELEAIVGAARSHRLRIHIDGARIFNAALASGISVAEIAGFGDTVTFCLSKGLGCPVGSVFCGSADAVGTARRWRKMLGGGWRQGGVLAAAGIYALDHMVDRLAEDHRNARTLAEGLAEIDGIELDPAGVESNIVIIGLRHRSAAEFVARCEERGLLVGSVGERSVRLVTHYGIDAQGVQKALATVAEVCA